MCRSLDINSRDVEQRVFPFIDGKLVESASNQTFEVINPSNGRKLHSIPAGCEADVNQAVVSARRAFEQGLWSEQPPSARKDVLHRWAKLIEARATIFDTMDATEMGKPVCEKRANAVSAAHLTSFCAEAIDKVRGDVLSSDVHSLVLQRRVPRGVVAAIVPWNFPTFNAVLKVAPALAAGNSVVLKPSELSSRSALRLAQLALEAGIPPGTLNVVPGLGETVGKALGLHADVDMLTFTGSSVIGKLMQQYAGQSNMKVVLSECGGKSPQVVFDDGIDLAAASDSIAQLLLTNQGQLCSTGSRLLVQKSIEPEMIERIAARIQQIVMGDALDPKTTFGPLVSAKQCSTVMRYIESAGKEGAQLVMGGRRVLPETGGFFVEPTLFRGVSPASRIGQEEIFGPVLSVMTFENVADAIRLANGTDYDLMAYVWTTDLTTGMQMAKSIRSSVMINATVPLGEGPGYAFSHEPAGQSGIGIEGGMPGIESYLRRHLVWFNHP